MSIEYKKKILCTGSLVLDILPKFLPTAGPELATTIVSEGHLTESPEFCIYNGGSVGNTGTALAKLGVPVRLKGKIGNDIIGNVIASIASLSGVESDLSVDYGEKSTASIALAIPGRDKSTIHQRGASQLIQAKDFTAETFNNIDILLLGYPTTMKYLYADKGAQLVEVLKLAKQCGVITAIDTSLPDLNSEPGKVDWKPILKNIAPYLDIFMPSLEEAIFMTDRDNYIDLIKSSNNCDLLPLIDEDRILRTAQTFIEFGIKMVFLKCGTRGIYLKTNSLDFLPSCWSNRELWVTPFKVDKVVSTTGAGDTSIAGFLCGISCGLNPEDSLSLSAFAASLCVSSFDTCSRLENAEKLLIDMKKTKHNDYIPPYPYWIQSHVEGVYKGKNDLLTKRALKQEAVCIRI